MTNIKKFSIWKEQKQRGEGNIGRGRKDVKQKKKLPLWIIKHIDDVIGVVEEPPSRTLSDQCRKTKSVSEGFVIHKKVL
jgi:hypothetical protein